jgi:ATP-dependent DNA ligase
VRRDRSPAIWGTSDVPPAQPDAPWGWVPGWPATLGQWRHPDHLADTAWHGKTILTPPIGVAASVVQRRADSVMRIKPLPAGFVIPAQPVKASKPPSGADWVHEIKHDGYRIIVRRDGPAVRLYSRSAHDWTARLSAIATAAHRIKAKSFTIDGEAVVLGPDRLSRFEELSRREAADTAVIGIEVGRAPH